MEVEEVLDGKPKFRFVEKGDRKDEDVYMAFRSNRGGQIFDDIVYLQTN